VQACRNAVKMWLFICTLCVFMSDRTCKDSTARQRLCSAQLWICLLHHTKDFLARLHYQSEYTQHVAVSYVSLAAVSVTLQPATIPCTQRTHSLTHSLTQLTHSLTQLTHKPGTPAAAVQRNASCQYIVPITSPNHTEDKKMCTVCRMIGTPG